MKRYSIVQRHKCRGIKTWYGRIFDTDTSLTKYVSLGVEKKKEAQEWRDRMVANQLSGKRDSDDSVKVEDTIETYLKSFDGSNITRRNYISAFERFKYWLTENKKSCLGDITPIEMTKFFQSLVDWAASSRKKRLSIYREWAKWVMDMYEVGWTKNPFYSIKVSGDKAKPRDFWTIEQVEMIIAACDRPLDRLMYAFMAFAGLRFNETRSLTVSDVFNEDGSIKETLQICGKMGKMANLPVCSRLKNQIISTYYTNGANRLFSEHTRAANLTSKHLFTTTNYNQNMRLKELLHSSPILASIGGKVHLHRFRHSFISNLVRSGANIRAVAELARHENVMITLNTYSHLLESDTRKVLDIFSTEVNTKQGDAK